MSFSPPKRFKLRTLLILTSIIAVPLGMCGKQWNDYRQEQAAITSMQLAWPDLWYESEYRGPKWIPTNLRPHWFDRVSTLDICGSMTRPHSGLTKPPSSLGDSELNDLLPTLLKLRELRVLQIYGTSISDASHDVFKELSAIPPLTYVYAENTKLSEDTFILRKRKLGLKIGVHFEAPPLFATGYSAPNLMP